MVQGSGKQTESVTHSTPRASHEKDADALVAAYIEPHPAKPGIVNYRLKENAGGCPVWAIIGDLAPGILTPAQVAREYDISREALDAALVFYARHRDIIDARIIANRID
jgi:hypothetical protein